MSANIHKRKRRMNKLLKGSAVFIDTTAFSNANFNMDSPAFVSFADLCSSGTFQLLSTDITKAEIESGIRQQIAKLCEHIKGATEFASLLGAPKTESLSNLHLQLEPEKLAVRTSERIEQFFSKCNNAVIPIPDDAAAQVIQQFLDKRPPFDTNQKKAEFPDAFVLHLLASIARQSKSDIYVISSDDDFKRTCALESNLVCLRSLSQLLNLVQMDRATTAQIEQTIKENSKAIKELLSAILASLTLVTDLPGISVIKNAVKLDDILETLVISCEDQHAVVDFVCQVEIDAIFEVARAPEFVVGLDSHTEIRVVNITLEFNFAPKNPAVFEVTSTWTPTNLHV